MPTLEDILNLTKDPALDELDKAMSTGAVKSHEITDKAGLLLGIRRGEIKPEELNPKGLGILFDKPYADLEKPRSVSQTITENIGRLMPQPMLEKEGITSPFATPQPVNVPQAQKEVGAILGQAAKPQPSLSQVAGQAMRKEQAGQPQTPEEQQALTEYRSGKVERIPLGDISDPLFGLPEGLLLFSQIPGASSVMGRIATNLGAGGAFPWIDWASTGFKGPRPDVKQTAESAGQFAAFGEVLNGIGYIAKALKSTPTATANKLLAQSKATNTPLDQVVKSTVSNLGTPTEAEVMAGKGITPEMKPYSPALTGAYAKQGKIPEVKPTELTPTEIPLKPEPIIETHPSPTALGGKGWTHDPGATPGEPIAEYRNKLAIIEREVEGGQYVLYEVMDNTGQSHGQFSTGNEAVTRAEQVYPTLKKVKGEITPYREGMEEVKPREAPPTIAVKPKPWEMTQDEFVKQYTGKWKAGVLTDEGKFVTGWDHGDALNNAQDAGYTISGDLGQRAGWRVAGQVVLDKDMPPNEKSVEAGMYQVLRQRFAPTPEAPPVEAKPLEQVPTETKTLPATGSTIEYQSGNEIRTGKVFDISTNKSGDIIVGVGKPSGATENVPLGMVTKIPTPRKTMEEMYPGIQAKPTEPMPPTQPEISAGVKEAPTEVAQYHDLQGRPITKAGEKPSLAKRLITEEKGQFEPYRPTPPEEENVFEPRVKEEIVATLTKTATPILKGQMGGDKRRLFQQIADLIDNHEIMTADIKPMLDKLNISPEQFASDWRETISGSGRDLYQLSRVAKELKKSFKNNPEAEKIMEDIAKQGPDNWWAITKDYWNKISRVWRASLISQLATGVRNLGSQVIRGGVDTVDYALQGFAKGDVKEVPYRIFDDMNALFHSFTKGPQRDFFMKALDAYPIERARMLSTSIHEVGALNKYTQALGIMYRGPEILQRKMAGQVQLARELSAIGKDFHTATLEDITQPMMERVAQKTLELTFAETPKSGFTKSLMTVWKEVPMLQLINPFPRFLFGNALKYLYEFSPLGATRLLSNGATRAIAGGNAQILSRATIGTGLIAMGAALRASQFAGEKWYQLKIGDHTYDTRPYAPFSSYLLIGEALVNPDNLHIADGALAIAGLNRLAGTGLVFIDWLQEGTTGKTAIQQLKQFGGQFAGGFTVPFRTAKDIIAGVSPKEDVIRSTKEDLLTGPARANIPGLSQTLPPVYSPYEPGEIKTEHPALRQFTGFAPRVVGPLETEVSRLKLDYRQIYPSTGIPEADRIITKNMGEFISQSPFPLDDPSYTESPEPMKRLMMREYFKQMRQAAKMQLYNEDPDLYQKVYEKGMDPDIMELMQGEQSQAGGE